MPDLFPDDAFYADVRTKLVTRRMTLGLSQRQLATRMNVAQSFVSALEIGRKRDRTTLATLAKWADALDMTIKVRVVELAPADPDDPAPAP